MIAEVYPADQGVASLLFTDVAVDAGPPLPLDGINYPSHILTRGERDPDLTLEVARFADNPVR